MAHAAFGSYYSPLAMWWMKAGLIAALQVLPACGALGGIVFEHDHQCCLRTAAMENVVAACRHLGNGCAGCARRNGMMAVEAHRILDGSPFERSEMVAQAPSCRSLLALGVVGLWLCALRLHPSEGHEVICAMR